MIPLKEEPTLAEALCFSPEDSDAVDTCRRALTHAGSVVITAAGNESLLAHYTRVLLSQMPGQNASGQSKCSVRRMPRDKDALLAALNRLLAELDFESVGGKQKVPTSEIWLYELPGPSDSELIVTTAKMIRQFKAAGVSIIVNSRQARPGSELLSKLSQRVRGTLVEFALPDKESCIALAEKVAGTSDALQVNGLIKDLGYTIQKTQPATLAAFPQDLNDGLSTQEMLTQRRPVKSTTQVPGNIAPTAALPTPQRLSPAAKKSLLVSGVFVSVALFGLYAINGNNWANMQSSASTLYADFTQSAEVVSSSIGETATNPSVEAVAVVAASPSAEKTLTPGAQSSVVTKSPEQMASLEASLAQTLEATDSEESLAELFVVTPPRPNANAVYIQHASFRLSQGAYIWKNNAKGLLDAQIFSKGKVDTRYVVVSGPFADRLEAQQYLDNVGVTDKAYFILGSVLGEQLSGPNNVLASSE
ncbi:hypothetical protein OAB62_03085 [Pseudomonadales bacterium]|nr:hypothetical protein [Pseudomonadales bacterium]MDB9756646.1 hypothetical protein [Pseudomonadales bacterium]